ncbi:MAG: hypothetical protein ACTSV5_01880 [Promethearchaeota archaeon]
MNQGRISIEGRIMTVNNYGEKRISRNYTYGYMILSVQVGPDLYSILVSSSKINTYGFLPRIGQYINAEGIRSPGRDGFHNYSLSHLSTLEHIESPKKKLK